MNLATVDLKIDAVERTRTRIFLDQTHDLENGIGIGLHRRPAPSDADRAGLVSGEDTLISRCLQPRSAHFLPTSAE